MRRFLEPLRRAVLPELVGDPETLIVDSTLLSVLHPRQVKQSAGWGSPSAGAAWVGWGSFSVYGANKLHLLCATDRAPICYELTAANVAGARLTGELLDGANLGDGVARRLFGGPAYRSADLKRALAACGVPSMTERSAQGGKRQQAEICFSGPKRDFGMDETLATTLVGLAGTIAAKITAYTHASLFVNRMLGRPQGRIEDLWART